MGNNENTKNSGFSSQNTTLLFHNNLHVSASVFRLSSGRSQEYKRKKIIQLQYWSEIMEISLIAVVVTSGCIFHRCEGNAVCLPRCLPSCIIISAHKVLLLTLISVFLLLSAVGYTDSKCLYVRPCRSTQQVIW
jgi:hypothetical protein